jgi:hypothetical protein
MLDYGAEDGWPKVTKRGWDAAEFRAADATFVFTPRQVGLLIELVEKTKARDLAVTEITRDVFDHPELHEWLVGIVRVFKEGQGLVLLDGFPVSEMSIGDIWRMYWGVGSHLGIAVSQNIHGHLMGQVTVQPGVVGGRVYGSSVEAALHSDRADALSLLCITQAKSGGDNAFVSSLKVWEVIEAERPDILALLKRGYPQHRNGEQAEGDSPVTPYRVPVFGEAEGLRSAYVGGNAMLSHQRMKFAEILTDADVEALEFLQAVIRRPEFAIRQQLGPGQAVFINNHEVLHSRTAFEDWDEPERRRRLLRMWLQGRPRRPYPADMNILRNRSGNLGIEVRSTPPVELV